MNSSPLDRREAEARDTIAAWIAASLRRDPTNSWPPSPVWVLLPDGTRTAGAYCPRHATVLYVEPRTGRMSPHIWNWDHTPDPDMVRLA